MFDTKFDVIAVGSSTRDVFLKSSGVEIRKHADSPTGIEQCFPLGSKIEIKEIVFTTGGGANNAIVTFARQGFKTACVSVLGKDNSAQEIIEELNHEGVSTNFMQLHGDDFTAYSTILVNPSGERTIFSYKGEGQHFNSKEIPVKKFKTKWLFLDSLGGHYDLYEKLVNFGVKNNIKIASNPGGKEIGHGLEKLVSVFKNIDVVSMNQEEAAGLLGVNYANGGVAKKLHEFVKDILIITDGPKGSIVIDGGGKEYRAGVPDSPIIERTGAGDAFASGFVCEYMKSGSIEKAIQFATANASSVVTKFGGKEGILKKGDWGPWPLVEVETH